VRWCSPLRAGARTSWTTSTALSAGRPPTEDAAGTGAFSIASSSDDGVTLEANRITTAASRHRSGRRQAVRPLRTRGRHDAGPGRLPVGGRPETAEFLSGRSRSTSARSSVLRLLADAQLRRPPFARLRSGARSTWPSTGGHRSAGPQGSRRRGGRPGLARYWARDPRAARAAFNPAEACVLLRAARLGPIEFTCLVPRTSRSSSAWRCSCSKQLGEIGRPHAAGVAAVRLVNQRIVSGQFDADMDLDSRRALRHGLPPLLALGGRGEALELLGLSKCPRDEALDSALDSVSEGNSARPSGGSKQRCATIRRRSSSPGTRRCSCEPPLHRAGDGAGRDAIYVLSRWLLRQPGSAAR